MNQVDTGQQALEEFLGDKQKGARVAAAMRELADVFKRAPGDLSRVYVLVISVQGRDQILTVTNVSTEDATVLLEAAAATERIDQITPDVEE